MTCASHGCTFQEIQHNVHPVHCASHGCIFKQFIIKYTHDLRKSSPVVLLLLLLVLLLLLLLLLLLSVSLLLFSSSCKLDGFEHISRMISNRNSLKQEQPETATNRNNHKQTQPSGLQVGSLLGLLGSLLKHPWALGPLGGFLVPQERPRAVQERPRAAKSGPKAA